MKRDQFEEHLAELMGSGITYAKMKSRDAVRAEYIRLTAELAAAREALERFAKMDLTSPIGNEIALDILNARAVLGGKHE